MESVRTVRIVSAYDSGRQWAALLGPTRAGQRASRVDAEVGRPALGVDQPRPGAEPSGLGSRSSGCAPETCGSTVRAAACAAGVGGAAPTERRWSGPAPARSDRAARPRRIRGSPAAIVGSAGAGSGGCAGRGRRSSGSLIGGDLAGRDPVAAPGTARGTSAPTAAVTSTCSAPLTPPASRSRRVLSSSANTSSSTSTGSTPSARSSWNAPSRSASAKDQDSPWLAYPLAGSGPRASTTSSRCGPTSETPRWISSGAAAACAVSSCSDELVAGQPAARSSAVL